MDRMPQPRIKRETVNEIIKKHQQQRAFEQGVLISVFVVGSLALLVLLWWYFVS